ncbi:MAG: iron dependent repressor, metal binding and dimerization domain protein [Phycisphaerae bacterium]
MTHDRYGVVKLTDVGAKLAECVVRRFEVLREFFINVLGLDEETAEVEACETEHVLSPDTIGRLEHITKQLSDAGFTPPANFTPPLSALCHDCMEAGTCQAADVVPLNK